MHKIAWLPGDGIGRDVMAIARLVLDALGFKAKYIHGDVGWEFWKKEANPLPDRTIKILRSTDCCIFGAITSKPQPEALRELEIKVKNPVYRSPIVRARQLLDLYANVRPCRAFPGNPLNYRDDIDIVVIRENTEGLYSGIGFYPTEQKILDVLGMQRHKPESTAIDVRVFTKHGCQRIIKYAFELAKKTGKDKVTVIEKPNVIRNTSGMMIQLAREITKDYPDIWLEEVNVDAMAMWLLKNPQNYGILVTSNMFGDIISDLAGQLVGGLGFAASGSYGDDYALFEPVHGSAPKYAGCFITNPIAMLLSVAMALEYLGEKKLAAQLLKGISDVIKEGKIRTYDMLGISSSSFNYKNPKEIPKNVATSVDMAIEIIAKIDLGKLNNIDLEEYKDWIRLTKKYF